MPLPSPPPRTALIHSLLSADSPRPDEAATDAEGRVQCSLRSGLDFLAAGWRTMYFAALFGTMDKGADCFMVWALAEFLSAFHVG